MTPAPGYTFKLLKQDLVRPPSKAARTLQLKPGARAVFLESVFYWRGKPFCYSHAHLPEPIGAAVWDEVAKAETPTINLVERGLGRRVVRADQHVEPAVAGAVEAGHMGMRPGAAILHVTRTYFLGEDEPVQS